MKADPFHREILDPVFFYGLLSDLEALVETQWGDKDDSEGSDEA